jgi:hypothetical protein
MNKIKSLADLEREKAAKKLLALEKSRLKVEADSIKAKKLQKAIDKAELALGKGTDIFDMDKIQNLAAQKNQAEQLGKATNAAQVLSITNDLARLEVMKRMSELEDAIASKDEAAITRATGRLNESLKTVEALNGQKLKMVEIEDILKSLLPRDLINIKNLNEAIALLGKIVIPVLTPVLTQITPTASTTSKLLTNAEVNDLLAAGSFVPVVAGTGGVMGGSSSAGAYASSGFPGADKNNGTVNITVNTGIGDPNAIAEAITEVVRGAVDRGTLRAS